MALLICTLFPSILWLALSGLIIARVYFKVSSSKVPASKALYWTLIALYPIQISVFAFLDIVDIISFAKTPGNNTCECSPYATNINATNSYACECFFPWDTCPIRRVIYDPNLMKMTLHKAIPNLTRISDNLVKHPLHIEVLAKNTTVDVFGKFDKYDFEEVYPEARYMVGVVLPVVAIIAVVIIPYYAYVYSQEGKKKLMISYALRITFFAFFEMFDTVMMMIMIIEKLPYFSNNREFTIGILLSVSVTILFVFLTSLTSDEYFKHGMAVKFFMIFFNNLPFFVMRIVIYVEYDRYMVNGTIGWTIFFMIKELVTIIIAMWDVCVDSAIGPDRDLNMTASADGKPPSYNEQWLVRSTPVSLFIVTDIENGDPDAENGSDPDAEYYDCRPNTEATAGESPITNNIY